MTDMFSATRRTTPREGGSAVQGYARAIAVLFLVSVAAGGFGEFLVPSRVFVANDAAATARNIASNEILYRLGFVGYLVEAVCDVSLAVLLYKLLRPAGATLALVAMGMRLVGTAVFAAAALFYFIPLVVLSGTDATSALSKEQLDALVLLSLRVYAAGGSIFFALYGIPFVIIGYLTFRSEYLPRLLGVLLVLGGVAFVVRNLSVVLLPAVPTQHVILPFFVAGAAFVGWLAIRGVDVAKWELAASSDGQIGP